MFGYDFAYLQIDVNPHILRMPNGTFSLDKTHINTRLREMTTQNGTSSKTERTSE